MVLTRPVRILAFVFLAHLFLAPAHAQTSRSEAASVRSSSEAIEFSSRSRRHVRASKKCNSHQAKRHARARSALAVRRTPVNPLLIDEQAIFVRPLLQESELVTEARRWIGTNPTNRTSLWCATFMNFVLERTGRAGTGSDLAHSFASYGQVIYGPQVGAIAVMTRGSNGGHVGVVSGIDAKGNPIVVSGNFGRKVAEASIPHSRIYAYVMPM
ncbi:MAG: TIGR02594 family protein [Alphaproteobacteria bacterium]|nr:TIGR02594 family protein [Alphaproteobacteria bacterium]